MSEPANKSNQIEIGALWKKDGKEQKFLAGNINLKNLTDEQIQTFVKTKELPVVIFSNKFKQKDTHPDLRVYLSKPKVSAPAPAAAPAKAAPAAAAPEEEII